MKKLMLTSAMTLSIMGAANATTYIGNPDTPTADWGNWIGAINTTSPETAAAVNNLAGALNDNAQTMDKMNEIMSGWNYHLFGENGDMTDGLFWSYYLRDGGVQKRLSALENSSVADDMAAGFGKLSEKISDATKDLSAGIASVAALSSVAVSNVERGEVSVGGGYGYHNGQSAAAFGFAVGLTDNWSMNAGAGISSADTTWRAGTNYKFKLF
ncbi:hypothetical protein HDR61_05175 [bacterium]|nr:hypothetical protein [bacterium]